MNTPFLYHKPIEMNAKAKWLIVLITLLALINIVLLATIWLKKDAGEFSERRGDARDYLIKSLSLNEAQIKSFDSLRKEHFERMNQYQEQMHGLKDDLFNELNHSPNAHTDTLAQRIGIVQTKIDLETFEHFSQLRFLLNEEQTKKFDTIIRDVLRTMVPRGGPPPRKKSMNHRRVNSEG